MKLYGYVGNVEGRRLEPGDAVEVIIYEAGPAIPASPVEFTERFAIVLPVPGPEQP